MNKEHQEFLNKLRAGGMINPFNMTPLLKKEFNLDYIRASDIVFEWITYPVGEIPSQTEAKTKDETQVELESLSEVIQ